MTDRMALFRFAPSCLAMSRSILSKCFGMRSVRRIRSPMLTTGWGRTGSVVGAGLGARFVRGEGEALCGTASAYSGITTDGTVVGVALTAFGGLAAAGALTAGLLG